MGLLWQEQQIRILKFFLLEVRTSTKRYLLVDNYEFGKVSSAIGQYVDGKMSVEKERDLRRAGFKFNIYQVRYN